MNVAPGPHPGARVQVTWTDGRVYPATITTVAQGFVHVQWDAGGSAQWVPLTAIAPLGAPPQAAMPAPQQAGWNPYPQYARQAPLPQQGLPQQAPFAQQQAPFAQQGIPQQAPSQQQGLPQQASIAQQGPTPQQAPIAQGSGPRPIAAKIRDLPRGLVYEPTGAGAGTGKVFFVLFGFVATTDADAAMRATDIDHIGDDVAALRAAGYKVIVDLHGDLETLNTALLGAHPDAGGAPTAGVFWGGHGDDDGTIGTHEGYWIAPEQVAPEVAQKGTVKLFVMSACHAGNHAARWQKALGPQAQIIGWGAPITNERAIEFLVPDDNNAKGFDDLIEKHLGARKVMADGPLVEVRDLAKQHEERIATMLVGLDELVKEATKRLKCKCEKAKNIEAYYMEVRTPPSKDYPDKPRSQLVRVSAMGLGDAWIYVSSLVGPYSDALDLARGLRAVAPAIHVRVALAKLNPDEPEFIVVETILRRRRLDPYTFANNVSTIGMYADKLEDLYFGSDKR